jgi:hypothetical protein
VHAVNNDPDATGLEVLDVQTGARKLVHKSATVVWDAVFSPDGRYIAYRMTLHEPPASSDDEPDCTPPTLGLWLFSVAEKTDRQVRLRGAPAAWEDVKNFSWSPDSKRLALTVGTTDCDYPGSEAGVFVTGVDLQDQRQISRSNMSFEPVFSPEGEDIAFVDFSDSPAKLLRYRLTDGSLHLIRRATEESNYYHLIGWK